MTSRNQALSHGNRLLAALPPEDFARLQPHLEPVALHPEQVLIEPGDVIRFGYFPLDGVISLLTVLEDGSTVEVANVGNEGFADATTVLSVTQSPYEAIAQNAGHVLRIEIKPLREMFRECLGLRDLLLRFTGVMLTCTGRALACRVTHSTQERLAKWLLMARDRSVTDDLPFTQEALARMLSVERPTISLAAEALKERGFIAYQRGHIQITDRVGLEEAACEHYHDFKHEYEQLLGPILAPAHMTDGH